MKKTKIKIILASALLMLILSSNVALAVPSWYPIIPCGTNANQRACEPCDIFRLALNVINFIVEGLMPPMAVLFIVYAGLLILVDGVFPGQAQKGTNIIKNIMWSIALMLGSWLLVNIFITSFVSSTALSNWSVFQCGGQRYTLPNFISGQPRTLTDLLNVVADKLFYLAIPIAVLLIIYAGILYLYSRGDANMTKNARNILRYVIIGLAIVFINKGFIILIKSILDLSQGR
jgi:hypothetical protein